MGICSRYICLHYSQDISRYQIIGDITDESFNAKLISSTIEKFGKLDVLVSFFPHLCCAQIVSVLPRCEV